jgi:hypothetical protein
MSKVQHAARSVENPGVLPAAPSRVAAPQEQPLRFLLIRVRPGELPPAANQGSIYENQRTRKSRFFKGADELEPAAAG